MPSKHRSSVPGVTDPSQIEISVALVTCDRPDALERCLQSWRRQEESPMEIVVSDDSEPALARKVRELADQYGCRYLPGPRQGLYANRNCAIGACGGTHILCADDDHTHPAEYLNQIRRLVILDPGRVWIFGARQSDDPCSTVECPPELHASGTGRAPVHSGDCAAIADGTAVYPRAVYDSGLRYDETYASGLLGYLWAQQLVRHGWRITFSPLTYVWHHRAQTGPLTEWNKHEFSLEAGAYVTWINALWLRRSPWRLVHAMLVTARRVLGINATEKNRWPCRLKIEAAWRAFRKALRASLSYQGPLVSTTAAQTALQPWDSSHQPAPSRRQAS